MQHPSEIAGRGRKLADNLNSMEEVPVSAYPKEFSQSWVNGELTGEQMKTTLLAFHKR